MSTCVCPRRAAIICIVNAIITVFSVEARAITTIWGPPEAETDYVTVPGQQQFGVDHDFIVSIKAYESGNPFVRVRATGFLLSTGRHIMTAAHVFDSPSLVGGGVEVRFDLPGGEITIPTVLIPIDEKVKIHEHYAGAVNGFDIAIIELPRDYIVEAQQQGDNLIVPELLPRVDKNLNPEGLEARLAGYGLQGNWEFGQTVPFAPNYIGDWGEAKILGKNRISAIGYDSPFLGNEQAMLFWDFDDAVATSTNFFMDPFTGSVEEVNTADEDSGGPVFVNTGGQWVVAGVTSGQLGADKGIGSDWDNVTNSSAGEIGFAVHLNQVQVYPWILDVVWDEKAMRPQQGWDGTWDDTTAWTNSALPGVGKSVTVGFNSAGDIPFLGPASSHTIDSLGIGTGSGLKQLLLSAGGSLAMPGDTVIDTNGSIVLETGTLSADSLVIQGTASVPQTPTPSNGFFIWSDQNGLGTSSLIVNRIEVGQDGVFEDRWSDPATRTFETPSGGYVDVDVLAGGQAIFEWTNTYVGDLTNSGVLSLGDDRASNHIATDSFVQTAGGSTIAYLSAVTLDYIEIFGPASLAGELEMRVWGGSAPTSGSAPIPPTSR